MSNFLFARGAAHGCESAMAPHALLLLLHLSLVSSAQSDACATFELRNSTGVSSSSPGSSSKVLDRVLSVTACCAACGAEALCSAFAYHPKGQGRGEDEQCKLVLSSSSSIQTKTSEGTIAGFAPSKPTPPPTVAPTMAPIAPRPPLGFQPNIIFIQTDDQDVEIGGLTPMPKLRSLLGERGASLRHWFVNTPVCCPSRTETLSGRYHHNMRDAPGQEWSNLHCGGDEAVGKPHACGCMRMVRGEMRRQRSVLSNRILKRSSPPLPPSLLSRTALRRLSERTTRTISRQLGTRRLTSAST